MAKRKKRLTTRDKQFGFRLPKTFYDVLEKKAEYYGMSVANYINICLVFAVNADVIDMQIKQMKKDLGNYIMLYPGLKDKKTTKPG